MENLYIGKTAIRESYIYSEISKLEIFFLNSSINSDKKIY